MCKRLTHVALLALGSATASALALPAEQDSLLSVCVSFPGGSAEILGIDQNARRICIRPGNREGDWPLWWCCLVKGIVPGETVKLQVEPAVLGEKQIGFLAAWYANNLAAYTVPDRAVWSLDGVTWNHTAPGARSRKGCTYAQQVNGTQAYFAWLAPYTLTNANADVQKAVAACAHTEAFTLAVSRAGHAVPAVRIRQPGVPEPQRYGVWVEARQHAFESGSSWVVSGLLEWLTSADARAATLRQNAEIVVVPIMDVDSVLAGNAGKEQLPVDYNRCWSHNSPYWPEVVAVQAACKAWERAGRMDLFLDLHNCQPNDRKAFYHALPGALLTVAQRTNQAAFVAASETEMTGPIPFEGRVEDTGMVGTAWRWVALECRANNPVVALTLESPWNMPEATPAGYREEGANLGRAIEFYLRGSIR